MAPPTKAQFKYCLLGWFNFLIFFIIGVGIGLGLAFVGYGIDKAANDNTKQVAIAVILALGVIASLIIFAYVYYTTEDFITNKAARISGVGCGLFFGVIITFGYVGFVLYDRW